ncbi:MAG: hypothetical protein ABI898_04510 [Sphingomonadales bacterium]
MNGLVPVLIAVLLAEFGPRSAIYADARLRDPSLWVIALGVIAAAIAGALVAPTLTGWADAFLIAIALTFAALGQAQKVKLATGPIPVIVAFWRGGVPLIAFAFATRFGALTVGLGALGGLLIAAVMTRVADSSGMNVIPIRWAAVLVLGIAAVVVATGALRLA